MPALLDAKTAAQGGPSPKSFTHTPVGTPTLAVVVCHRYRDPTGGKPTVTYGGIAMTEVADAGDLPGTTIFYLVAPPAGAQTVTVSWANNNTIVHEAYTFTGTFPTSPIGTPQSASGTGTSSSLSVSGFENGITLDALSIYEDPGTVTIGANQNSELSNTYGELRYRESTEPGAATNTMSWSWVNSKSYSHCAIPIKPAPSSGGQVIMF